MKPCAVLALSLLLAGCSGGGDGLTSSAPPSPAEVASRIGCKGFETDMREPLYVQDAGNCSIGDEVVRVLTFNDNTARDAFVKKAKIFGGHYAVADRVAIEGSTSTIEELDGKDGLKRA